MAYLVDNYMRVIHFSPTVVCPVDNYTDVIRVGLVVTAKFRLLMEADFAVRPRAG